MPVEPGGFDDLRAVLLAKEIMAVRYWSLEEQPIFVDPHDPESAHEIIAVDLELASSEVFRVSWAMDAGREGVSFDRDTSWVPSQHKLDRIPGALWDGIVGQQVAQVRGSWQFVDGWTTLWSITIESDRDRSVSIALGEVQGATVTYIPDSLVVLSRWDADRYCPTASSLSASGV